MQSNGNSVGSLILFGLFSPPQQPEQQAEEKENEQAQPRTTTPMEDKIVNDTVAWARAMAELRGRNADWAARCWIQRGLSVTNIGVPQ